MKTSRMRSTPNQSRTAAAAAKTPRPRARRAPRTRPPPGYVTVTTFTGDDPGTCHREYATRNGTNTSSTRAERDLRRRSGWISAIFARAPRGDVDRRRARRPDPALSQPADAGIRPSPLPRPRGALPVGRSRTSTSTRNVTTSFSWNGEGTPMPGQSSAGPTDCRSPRRRATQRGARRCCRCRRELPR